MVESVIKTGYEVENVKVVEYVAVTVSVMKSVRKMSVVVVAVSVSVKLLVSVSVKLLVSVMVESVV